MLARKISSSFGLLLVLGVHLTASAHKILTNEIPVEVLSPMGTFQGCSAGQQQFLQQAEIQSKTIINQVVAALPNYHLDGVRKVFIEPNHRQFTEGAPINARYEQYLSILSSVFSKMKSVEDRGANYACRSNAYEPHCRGGEVEAYVLADYSGHSYQMMYLCDGYFKNMNDVSGAVTTMVHEMSHYAADTEDYGLDWWNAKNPNILRGAMDAYHIQAFTSHPVEIELRNTIWYWLWPAQPAPTPPSP